MSTIHPSIIDSLNICLIDRDSNDMLWHRTRFERVQLTLLRRKLRWIDAFSVKATLSTGIRILNSTNVKQNVFKMIPPTFEKFRCTHTYPKFIDILNSTSLFMWVFFSAHCNDKPRIAPILCHFPTSICESS